MTLRFALGLLLVCRIAAAAPPDFKAGASRIDITPSEDESLPMSGYAARKEGHKGIHDNLYVRAIALEAGTTRAAIVTADLIAFSHDFWSRVTRQMESVTGIPQPAIMLVATHTHAAPSLGTYEPVEPGSKPAEYIRRVEQAMVNALQEAVAALRPARVGAGEGRANVNVNRRALRADGTWMLGINPDGPSDKTLAVTKFETIEGEPIAILMNYAVHGTGMSQENYVISADVPGAASRYLEQHFGDKVVAPWTSGAAGDQCPIYDRQPRSFEGILAIGRILGEETLRVAASIKTSANAEIKAAQTAVTCPGQKLTPGPRRRPHYVFEDANPVDVRLSLLRIGHIAFAGVSGEVLTMIGQRFKKQSPAPHTAMITHCNGSSGYLPDDDAYNQVSYEIQVSKVKPGCAEKAIIEGLLTLFR
jgi:hypothetical protein